MLIPFTSLMRRHRSNRPAVAPQSTAISRDAWVLQPPAKLMELLGLENWPAGQPTTCRIRHVERGGALCEPGAAKAETFVICRGLALRRHPDRGVPHGIGIAGPREVLGLTGARGCRHTEALVAITALEVAVLETQRIFTGKDGRELLARIVAGPQSVAHLRHLAQFVRMGNLRGKNRVRAGLHALANLLGHDRARLSDVVLHSRDFAHWLAMTPGEGHNGLNELAAEGLLCLSEGKVLAIDVNALATGALPAL